MALSIENPEAEKLARELARRTGESITEAVVNSLRERLRREEGRVRSRDLVREGRYTAGTMTPRRSRPALTEKRERSRDPRS
jgi:hypothetical protein